MCPLINYFWRNNPGAKFGESRKHLQGLWLFAGNQVDWLRFRVNFPGKAVPQPHSVGRYSLQKNCLHPNTSTQFKVEKQSSNVRSPFPTHHTPWKPSNLHAQIEFSNEKREIGRGPIPAKVHNVCNKTIFYSGNVVPFRNAGKLAKRKKAETTRTGEIWFNERK